ncbi:MAG: DUF4349 domain-containing protein [Chloroflexi bacterium]|nr:MAG: DUF4349 domain-containing protein [Chloroflexota bacterium]
MNPNKPARSTRTKLVWKCLGLVLGLTILAVMSTACGAAGEPAAQKAVEAEMAVAPEAPAADVAGRGGEVAESAVAADSIDDILANAVAQAQSPRLIIYQGSISLVVKDTRQAAEQIARLATEQGGYVANTRIYQSGDVPRGSVTIRVPAEKYADTLAQLRNMAERVEKENTDSQDVTEEFTDLQARKTNLEYTEAALQKLLEERQKVGRTSDILEVYRELTNIRGQIEQIEGRMRYLANQAALSTISIELIPSVLYQPVSVAGWEPQGVAKEALQALVAALQNLANIAIWLVIFVLPLLVILSLPVIVVIWVIRWWWKRYRRQKAGTTAPAAEE